MWHWVPFSSPASFFILFSFFKVREMLVNALPMGLKMSIAAGIGLFLALIALKGAGVIVANPATLVGLGDIHQPTALLADGRLCHGGCTWPLPR